MHYSSEYHYDPDAIGNIRNITQDPYAMRTERFFVWPLATGAITLVVLSATVLYIYVSAWCITRGTKEETECLGSAAAAAKIGTTTSFQYSSFLTKIKTVGSQITVCCGFLTYNLITFRTDIVDVVLHTTCEEGGKCGSFVTLPDICTAEAIAHKMECHRSLFPAVEPFLATCCITFCLGFATVIISTNLQIVGDNWFLCEGHRTLYAKKMRIVTRWTLRSYYVALLLFLVCHGFYGFVKMNPVRYEPMIASALAAIAIGVGYGVIFFAYRGAKAVDSDEKDRQKDRQKDKKGKEQKNNEKEFNSDHHTTEKKYKDVISHFETELSGWPGRSLFFGAFAYFAIMFFYTPDRVMTAPYLFAMGMSFSCGITIVTLTAFLRIRMASLLTPPAQAYFAEHVSSLVRGLYAMYVSSFVLFFVGFSLIGFIKPGFAQRFDGRFAPPIAAGGILAVLGTVYLTVTRRTECAITNFALDSQRLRLTRADYEANDYYAEWKQLTSQQNNLFAGQATFVAGNAFFEILFSDIDVTSNSKTLASWGYVISNVLSCTFGFLIVCWTTQINRVLVSNLMYARRDQSNIFRCWLLVTFSWVFSLLCLDEAKYPHILWGVTFFWGCFALLVLIVVLYTVRAIRTTARILIEDQNLMT